MTTDDKLINKNKLIESVNRMHEYVEANHENCQDRYVDGYNDALEYVVENIKLQQEVSESTLIKAKLRGGEGSAREMFEKMGFEYSDRDIRISYANKNNICINFSLITMEVDILFGKQERHYLEPSLYKAIHKQLLELGWLDD